MTATAAEPLRLLFLLGTRPEAIKQAPLIVAAKDRAHTHGDVAVRVVSTGQHREMLAPILESFRITPDRDLSLMQPNQTLESLTARALTALSEVLREEKPQRVIVQGDTTTAMAGALAAFYANVPVVHLEAGLRTNDLRSPYPEELNRRIIGQIAMLHLAPTEDAAAALRSEGIERTGARIVVTGNTVIDALLATRDAARARPPQDPALAMMLAAQEQQRPVVLITGHRRENFGAAFESFCLGLRDIAEAEPRALLVYPVHLNPNVQEPVRRLLGGTANLHLVPAADYPVFVAMLDAATLVITDSGGVQEEAPALGKPVLVTRTTTERPEAVDAGGVLLIGPDRARIREEALRLLRDPQAYAQMAVPRFPYGDGKAAARALDAVRGQ